MIPDNLKNDTRIKFCKIRKGTKKPFEHDWTNIPYSYEDIKKHVENETNYGVLCGYGGLAVIDCDQEELSKAVKKNLSETFAVKTGGGGTHYYYICKDLKKKIILERDKTHYGEVQSYGAQVVGPNSIHPNGRVYEVLNDKPIIEITIEDLQNSLKPFMKEVKEKEITVLKWLNKYKDYEINNINISSLLNLADFKKASNGEYYGCNPWHGSDTRMNFWINLEKNVAHCFRCDCGLNVAQIIALNHGIISDCTTRLSKEQFFEVLKIAKEKYGLKNKPKEEVSTSGIEKAINTFLNKKDLAHQFLVLQPLYYDNNKIWWMWNFDNYKWIRVDETDLLNAISKNSYADTIDSSEKSEILEALKQTARLNKPLENNPNWIQFKNKIYDIETNKIFEASSKYFISNPIPWEIGLTEDTPTIDKIFSEWVKPEYVRTLYEIIAYSLLTHMPIHRIICLIGEGRNGKTTFLKLLEKFLGKENVCSTDLDVLIKSNFESSKLYKKLVCIIGEIDQGIFYKTSVIKRLVGDDLTRIEFKGKDGFDTHNYALPISPTNILPEPTDKTTGFFSKWTIVDFPNQFTADKNILDSIPEIEYNNLAKKSTRIVKELLEAGKFTNDGSFKDREKKYQEHSNPMDKFIAEYCIKDINNQITFNDFYYKFLDYLKQSNLRVQSNVEVGKNLAERGFVKRIMAAKDGLGNSTTKMFILGLCWNI